MLYSCFSFENDIYLCTGYISPINSSYSNTKKLNVDIIDAIEKDIILYKQKEAHFYKLGNNYDHQYANYHYNQGQFLIK
jgi:hypothetical protein